MILSTAAKINLTNNIKNAKEKTNPATANPGMDSKIENVKLCQCLITIPGSEKTRDKSGPKFDSVSTCLTPMKANIERTKKRRSKTEKNSKFFLIMDNSFSRPKRRIIREKRPRGVVETGYSVEDFS